MGIIYHSAEHFDANDPINEKFLKKRNFIGWYDGRPVKILEVKEPYSGLSAPDGNSQAGYLNFSSHKDGIFSIKIKEKEIRLDFSFSSKSIYDSAQEPELQGF